MGSHTRRRTLTRRQMGCGASSTKATSPTKAPLHAVPPLAGMKKSTSTSVADTIEAVNHACRESGYSCQLVSWDDAQRYGDNEYLSCWGGNITDTRLWEKHGRQLYTVRSDNWNERLGKVDAANVAMPVNGQTMSLQTFLENAGALGSYAGLDSAVNLSDGDLDREISIRFQTVFLPVDEDNEAPQNLLLLASSQGTAVQADGVGPQMVYHHSLQPTHTYSVRAMPLGGGRVGPVKVMHEKVETSAIHRHWLEAERSTQGVGGKQIETEEEATAAAARGKAVSQRIGIEAMGSRFNTLMTVQIPLQQRPPTPPHRHTLEKKSRAKVMKKSRCALEKKSRSKKTKKSRGGSSEEEGEPTGISNAARVSKGSKVDTWHGLDISTPTRHSDQHITITVVTYYTVAGGVPSREDVLSAVADLDHLYASCGWNGQLIDGEAAFMKAT